MSAVWKEPSTLEKDQEGKHIMSACFRYEVGK